MKYRLMTADTRRQEPNGPLEPNEDSMYLKISLPHLMCISIYIYYIINKNNQNSMYLYCVMLISYVTCYKNNHCMNYCTYKGEHLMDDCGQRPYIRETMHSALNL